MPCAESPSNSCRSVQAFCAAVRGRDMYVARIRHEPQHGVSGSDDPCRSVEVGRFPWLLRGRTWFVRRTADSWFRLHVACPVAHTPACSAEHRPAVLHQLLRKWWRSAHLQPLLAAWCPGRRTNFQSTQSRSGGRTCLGSCLFASDALPSSRSPPPPCKRRHRCPVHGPPSAVGALRATLAGDVFEALGEMPETRRMSTAAERSAGCDL